ncbi:Hypothetical predicted protein [Olea europaea subsp. europaea]|uniref:Glycine-rich protein n=1 Tax=Olea europaea subsp. europaea TaxID=158383 RepID=A0A8S0PF85_OLEEU|nr:Hypothetical predicted protein [Olea europaea subsp. europaea]
MSSNFVLLVLLGVLICTTNARKLIGTEGSFDDEKKFFDHWDLAGRGLGGGFGGGGGGRTKGGSEGGSGSGGRLGGGLGSGFEGRGEDLVEVEEHGVVLVLEPDLMVGLEMVLKEEEEVLVAKADWVEDLVVDLVEELVVE